MKVMSYNIHHGVGMDEQLNIARIANVIKDAGVKIIGLQEVDKYFGSRSDFKDQAKEIAEILGFNYCFGGNLKVQDGGYGNAIISEFPIVNYENTLLTSAEEQRGCLRAEIDVNGITVNFYNTHLALNLET